MHLTVLLFGKLMTLLNKFLILNCRMLGITVLAALVLILVFDIGMRAPYNLISLLGMAVYIGLFYTFSKNPAKVITIVLLSP